MRWYFLMWIMNRKPAVLALLWGITALPAPLALAAGQVSVTGRILDNTCVVSVSSQSLTVKMETEGHKAFFRPGDTGTTNPFSIVLERCGPAAKGVTLNFQGTADPGNQVLLAVNGGAGSAVGLGIGIYERDGTPVPLNKNTRSYALTGGAPRVELKFHARYVAVSVPVKPGLASGTVTFTHTYD